MLTPLCSITPATRMRLPGCGSASVAASSRSAWIRCAPVDRFSMGYAAAWCGGMDTESGSITAAVVTGKTFKGYPKWTGSEPCMSSDPEFFYPDDPNEAVYRSRTVKRICDGCPTREPCGEWGILHETYGFWGGLSPSDRSRIRKRLGIVVKTPEGD